MILLLILVLVLFGGGGGYYGYDHYGPVGGFFPVFLVIIVIALLYRGDWNWPSR